MPPCAGGYHRAMKNAQSTTVCRLGNGDTERYVGLMTLFGEVFDDAETYTGARPDAAYVESLLADSTFIALVALDGEDIVGGLAAYELRKFEQARSEVYIYDLAVAESHRRQGVATALIEVVREIASACGAWVVFVQADQGDEPPIALYSSLGEREDVVHFDIAPTRRGR